MHNVNSLNDLLTIKREISNSIKNATQITFNELNISPLYLNGLFSCLERNRSLTSINFNGCQNPFTDEQKARLHDNMERNKFNAGEKEAFVAGIVAKNPVGYFLSFLNPVTYRHSDSFRRGMDSERPIDQVARPVRVR